MLPSVYRVFWLLRSSWTGASPFRRPRFSLRDYLDRKVCMMILTSHERDWFTWQALGVSRCRHCRSPMPEPFTEAV